MKVLVSNFSHIHQHLVTHNLSISSSATSTTSASSNTNGHHHCRIEADSLSKPTRLVSALIKDEKLDENRDDTREENGVESSRIMLAATNLKSRCSTHPDISTDKTVIELNPRAESTNCLEVEKLADIEKKSVCE